MFRRRLMDRLAAQAPRPHPVAWSRSSRAAASLMVAAAVALLIFEGAGKVGARGPASTPPRRPMPMVTANPGPPFVTFAELSVPTFRSAPRVGWVPPREGRRHDGDSITVASWAVLPQ